MRLIIVKDREEGCRLAARYFAHMLYKNPNAVFGLATGSSPIPLYRLLSTYHKSGWKDAMTFNLDEYVGVAKDDETSYHAFMHTHLFDNIDIQPHNIHLLDSHSSPDDLCQYEEDIKTAGGIDLQLLGIGQNGHIGFNEPGSSFESTTRLVDLTPSTLEANKDALSTKNHPTQAFTMGIQTILNAREICVLAWGSSKAKACFDALIGPMTTDVPASVLCLHEKCMWILDEDAASLISQHDRTRMCVWNTMALCDRGLHCVVFSPHPDDDVIAMGATISRLAEHHHVTIVYQTSGFRGIPTCSRDEATLIRQGEARAAVDKLGSNITTVFLNSPFYELKQAPSHEDVDLHIDLLERLKPDVVFAAGDYGDPHGTHEKCTGVLLEALHSKQCTSKGITEGVHHVPREVWLYKGAWEEWNIDEVDLIIPYDEECAARKKQSILCHASQTVPAFAGTDIRPFWQRADDRCKAHADQVNKRINNYPFHRVETFRLHRFL